MVHLDSCWPPLGRVFAAEALQPLQSALQGSFTHLNGSCSFLFCATGMENLCTSFIWLAIELGKPRNCRGYYPVLLVGLPYAWVNLRHGMKDSRRITENNVAACGSLLLEMGTLSRLTGHKHSLTTVHFPVNDLRTSEQLQNTIKYLCMEEQVCHLRFGGSYTLHQTLQGGPATLDDSIRPEALRMTFEPLLKVSSEEVS